MELPIFNASDLISSLDWVDHVFVNSIDEEYLKDVQSTVVLLRESQNDLNGYGNNRFRNLTYGIELQIFYSASFNQSTLDVEIKLSRLMEKNDWVVTQSKEHTEDPDTGQVTKVFYFAKNIILED